jgi:hypothetical protein
MSRPIWVAEVVRTPRLAGELGRFHGPTLLHCCPVCGVARYRARGAHLAFVPEHASGGFRQFVRWIALLMLIDEGSMTSQRVRLRERYISCGGLASVSGGWRC